jgi:hypothetical protein
MWLMTKMVLLLHEVLVVSSPKHEVLGVVPSIWKAHVKSKVSSKNELYLVHAKLKVSSMSKLNMDGSMRRAVSDPSTPELLFSMY